MKLKSLVLIFELYYPLSKVFALLISVLSYIVCILPDSPYRYLLARADAGT